MEKMSHHSVRIRDIELSRYHPPTPENITLANRDIGYFTDMQNTEGLQEIGRVVGRAAGMVSSEGDVECYRGLSVRLNGVLVEMGENPIHFPDSSFSN